MKLILFFKMRKIENSKKISKVFLILEIWAFESVPWIYLHYGENTCDQQSACYQTVLRFQIWLRDIFSNSISLELMESLEKSAAMQILSVSATSEQADSRRVIGKRSFRAFK